MNVVRCTIRLISTVALVALLLVGSFSSAQDTPPPRTRGGSNLATAKQDAAIAEIKRMESELARAVVARDYETLRRIEADTYVYTDGDARVSTREEFIRAYQSGESRIPVLRFDDLIVAIYGNAAVVRGVLTVEREDKGVAISRRARYTRFYLRLPAGWRAVAGHSSTLKTASK